MGFPGPGTIGQMVPGTRDIRPYGPRDQGPLAKFRLEPGTKAVRSLGTRDHSENFDVFHMPIFRRYLKNPKEKTYQGKIYTAFPTPLGNSDSVEISF